jgi:hypothetical protein
MTDEQIEEAAASAMVSVGASALLHGTGYSPDMFQQELEHIVNHIKSRQGVTSPQ